MKSILRLLAAVLTVALFCGAVVPAQNGPQTKPLPAQQARNEFVRAYKIGPEDLLSISVFEVPELNIEKVRVSQDGSISLPLLGRVEVGGLTQDGVAQKLTELLQAKYVKNPQVTIFIEEYKSQQVAVIGAVENPGSYKLVGRRTLLQVISDAGGFTDKAANQIFILRETPDGKPTTITIDLNELVINANSELNVPIEPNDVINVPVDRDIRVFVTGRVTDPGPVLAKMSQGLTLLQAIAGAGGLAQGAKQTAIMIKRVNAKGVEERFKINLKDIIKGKKKDFKLQEGDVVHVPESFW
jgi:polysaccharide biosynthesis/export protein